MSDGFVLKVSKRGEAQATQTSNSKEPVGVNADDGYVMTKWRQERIWIEAIDNENKAIKEWQDKWSFLAEYDQKGNIKEKNKLPDRVNMFSDKVPSSYGHVYGHRNQTEEAKLIANMESVLSANYKKRRNNALICYN